MVVSLSKSVLKTSYHQSHGASTLFFKHFILGVVTVLIIYKDDIIVTGNNFEEIVELKSPYQRKLRSKTWVLKGTCWGYKFQDPKKGNFYFSKKNVQDLFKETGMLVCKPVNIPTESNIVLEKKMKNLWLTKASTKE